MDISEIKPAIDAGDMNEVRRAFRLLVDPAEERIIAPGPGPLVIALKAVCEALVDDKAVMPRATCEALGIIPGASYATGARAAEEDTTRAKLVTHLKAAHGLTMGRAM